MKTKKEPKASNKANMVANHANPRYRGPTKAESRLKIRQKDWEKTIATTKVNNPELCFHKPGSLQK